MTRDDYVQDIRHDVESVRRELDKCVRQTTCIKNGLVYLQ